jgi:hypothetical protein
MYSWLYLLALDGKCQGKVGSSIRVRHLRFLASTGAHMSVLDYSVLAASGGAFMLATARRYAWSVDEAIGGGFSGRP